MGSFRRPRRCRTSACRSCRADDELKGVALATHGGSPPWVASRLKAPRIAGHYARLAEQGRAAAWSLEDYLAAVLAVESNARVESGARQRIWYAGFPAIKTITDFDFTAQPALDRAQIARLEGGGWLAEARNVVLLGPPGTGKTHLATALAIAAAQAGHRVAFAAATGLRFVK